METSKIIVITNGTRQHSTIYPNPHSHKNWNSPEIVPCIRVKIPLLQRGTKNQISLYQNNTFYLRTKHKTIIKKPYIVLETFSMENNYLHTEHTLLCLFSCGFCYLTEILRNIKSMYLTTRLNVGQDLETKLPAIVCYLASLRAIDIKVYPSQRVKTSKIMHHRLCFSFV